MIVFVDEIQLLAVVVVSAELNLVRIVDVVHGIPVVREATMQKRREKKIQKLKYNATDVYSWIIGQWNDISLTAGFGWGANRCAPTVVRIVVGTMRFSIGDGDGLKRVGENVSRARFVSNTSPFSSVLYKMFGNCALWWICCGGCGCVCGTKNCCVSPDSGSSVTGLGSSSKLFGGNWCCRADTNGFRIRTCPTFGPPPWTKRSLRYGNDRNGIGTAPGGIDIRGCEYAPLKLTITITCNYERRKIAN